MKLIKVHAKNLKGFTFSLDLRAINFIIGSNFAGKSARTDAIRLLLVGHLPELGKLPKATFGLCSGKELVVEGEFDDGSRILRRWYLKGDSVRTEELLPPWYEEAGPGLNVMLNAETYFALSERDRVAYVFANIPGVGGEFGEGELLAGINSALADKVAQEEDEPRLTPKAAEAFSALLISMVRERRDDSGFEGGWNPQQVIDFALEKTGEIEKNAKATAARMEKTAQGIATLRVADEAPVDVAKLDADIAAVKTRIADLTQRKFALGQEVATIKATRKQRDELTRRLGMQDAFKRERDARAAALDAARKKLAELPAPGDPAVTRELNIELVDARASLRDQNRQKEEVLLAITRNEAELAGVGAKNVCPYCGASGEGWKALKIAEINSALAGLAVKRDQLAEQIGQVGAHVKNLEARILAAINVKQAHDTATLAVDKAARDLSDSERHLSATAQIEADLAALPADNQVKELELDDTQTSLNGESADLFDLEGRRTRSIGRDNDKLRLAQAEAGRDEAKLEEIAAKAVAVYLRAKKAEMVAAAFGPLLLTANSICASILKSPLAYSEGEIGTWRDGAWVGHRTFSGTEKAVAYAAIQAALSSASPVRIMIIDELGRLDGENAGKIAECIAVAIELTLLDQFVGIDVAERYVGTELSSSQVIQVG